MSDRFTDSIEPFALATQGWTIEGSIPLVNLERFSGVVRSSRIYDEDENAVIEGDIEFSLNFDRDESGAPRITGNATTRLKLQCQRCMEDMDYPILLKVRLGIVSSREAAENLPDNYDPLLVSGDDVSIASILEDELILAMPIVAMHEEDKCTQIAFTSNNNSKSNLNGENSNLATVERENPFAVLAQLKESQLKKS